MNSSASLLRANTPMRAEIWPTPLTYAPPFLVSTTTVCTQHGHNMCPPYRSELRGFPNIRPEEPKLSTSASFLVLNTNFAGGPSAWSRGLLKVSGNVSSWSPKNSGCSGKWLVTVQEGGLIYQKHPSWHSCHSAHGQYFWTAARYLGRITEDPKAPHCLAVSSESRMHLFGRPVLLCRNCWKLSILTHENFINQKSRSPTKDYGA